MEPAARRDQDSSVAAMFKSIQSQDTYSAALPDTGKQDTDTDIVTADISCPCNGFAMLRRNVNWCIYYYYYITHKTETIMADAEIGDQLADDYG